MLQVRFEPLDKLHFFQKKATRELQSTLSSAVKCSQCVTVYLWFIGLYN